ncbi:dCTP deaminase/dUTPase family protein [Halococcoides cellulosivorans]|uniref:dCTP deaminase n=1 Tax=Halococcoides cellulosivorans TaxID=1679096 RepID=UPI001F23DD83|nr:dCTP deaminase [Halococcoides cellulosivorans]
MTDLRTVVDGLVHEPTQTEGPGVDCTVEEVFEVTTPGRIDFGGGELEAAGVEAHDREFRSPDDEYEWWHLDAGQYLVAFNESLDLPEDRRAVIQPRDALLARGASHPTVHTATLDRLPLSVGGAGLKLKENARISTLIDIE